MATQFPPLDCYSASAVSSGPRRPLPSYELCEQERSEVLQFLGERPLHTVVMSGFIRDNGLESWLNRGTFYGYRNEMRVLEGVALIGHATFLEARSDEALKSFARLAQRVGSAHMILGEQEVVQRFWNLYSPGEREKQIFSREVLFSRISPVESFPPVAGLGLARLSDLSLIIPVHAALAYEESGINPLDVDPDGFSSRCARRVRQNRTWVWIQDGRLVFKADLVSDTPQASYLEGIYVVADQRGRGHGSRCMIQIVGNLLRQTKAVVLLVNEQRERAQTFFEKIGFTRLGLYETVFLEDEKKEKN